MVVTTVGGAILGAALGGSRAAGQGAVIGAVVGAGRCSVLMEMAAAEDRESLRQAELSALRANTTQTKTIRTKSGKSAKVRTKVSVAPLPYAPLEKKASPVSEPVTVDDPKPIEETKTPAFFATLNSPKEDERVSQEVSYEACRYTEMSLDVDGSTAETEKQRWCRTASGDWQPVS